MHMLLSIDEEKNRLPFLQVCHIWGDIALDNPRCWNHVFIEYYEGRGTDSRRLPKLAAAVRFTPLQLRILRHRFEPIYFYVCDGDIVCDGIHQTITTNSPSFTLFEEFSPYEEEFRLFVRTYLHVHSKSQATLTHLSFHLPEEDVDFTLHFQNLQHYQVLQLSYIPDRLFSRLKLRSLTLVRLQGRYESALRQNPFIKILNSSPL